MYSKVILNSGFGRLPYSHTVHAPPHPSAWHLGARATAWAGGPSPFHLVPCLACWRVAKAGSRNAAVQVALASMLWTQVTGQFHHLKDQLKAKLHRGSQLLHGTDPQFSLPSHHGTTSHNKPKRTPQHSTWNSTSNWQPRKGGRLSACWSKPFSLSQIN